MLSQEEILAQLDSADEKYRTGATGTPVQDDQDAREALDDSPHIPVTNEEFADLESVTVNRPGVRAEVYDGGNIVEEMFPQQYTYFTDKVYDAVQSGDVFTTGGTYSSNYTVAAPYVDNLTLIAASILTGEKFF
jgi:hypothetical protein